MCKMPAIKKILQEEPNNMMLISNYSFFSIFLDQSLNAPNRWYLTDRTVFPTKRSKPFKEYKNFFINLIKKNITEIIYISGEINQKIIFDYLCNDCFEQKNNGSFLKSFQLNKNCKNLK